MQEYAEAQGSRFKKLSFPNENNSQIANHAKLIEMKKVHRYIIINIFDTRIL